MEIKNQETLNNLVVVKRSGQRVGFNGNKIAIAIKQAFDSVLEDVNEFEINKIYENVLNLIEVTYQGRKTINVEDIQDLIEKELVKNKYLKVYEHFKTYRQKRTALRKIFEEKQDHKFAKAVEKLSDLTRNNEGNFSLDIKNEFGTTIAKEYAKAYILENKFMKLLDEGIIEINQIDEYITAKTQGAHLDFSNLNAEGIEDYIDLMLKNIDKYKKEQYGEQTIPSFDYIFINIFIKEFKNILKHKLQEYLRFQGILDFIQFNEIENKINQIETIYIDKKYFKEYLKNKTLENIFEFAITETFQDLKEKTYFNLKKFLLSLEENLTDCSSKISISLGTNNKNQEAVIIRILFLKAIMEVKNLKYVNIIYKINTINDEELKVVLDIIKKKKYVYILFESLGKDYKNELEVFSTGERIYSNVIKDTEQSIGRILLSTTSINLARLGLECKDQTKKIFYERLTEVLEIAKNQLVQRFEIQGNKYKENYQYLFSNNVIFENNKLEEGQKIRKILRNGVLNISLVGLCECSKILAENKPEEKALEILQFINKTIKNFTIEEKLNFIVSESYDKKILEKLISIDKSIYGKNNLLNKNKYDNFCKIYEKIENDKKMKLEERAKYQELISSVINVQMPEQESFQDFKELIQKLKNAKVIFCKINIKDKKD